MKSFQEALFPSREIFNITQIAERIIKLNQIDSLMQCVFGVDKKISDRALWAMSHCSQIEPKTISPYYKKIIEKLHEPNLSDAYKRNALHLFSDNNVPVKEQTFMLDYCYQHLQNASEAIAIRALCIPIIYKLSQPYPELIQELKLVLQHILAQENPPALLAKARIVLKQIKKSEK